jgi:hypothetical protein
MSVHNLHEAARHLRAELTELTESGGAASIRFQLVATMLQSVEQLLDPTEITDPTPARAGVPGGVVPSPVTPPPTPAPVISLAVIDQATGRPAHRDWQQIAAVIAEAEASGAPVARSVADAVHTNMSTARDLVRRVRLRQMANSHSPNPVPLHVVRAARPATVQRAAPVDYDTVTRIALEARRAGRSMRKAVAAHFNIPESTAEGRLSTARAAGYPVPSGRRTRRVAPVNGLARLGPLPGTVTADEAIDLIGAVS